MGRLHTQRARAVDLDTRRVGLARGRPRPNARRRIRARDRRLLGTQEGGMARERRVPVHVPRPGHMRTQGPRGPLYVRCAHDRSFLRAPRGRTTSLRGPATHTYDNLLLSYTKIVLYFGFLILSASRLCFDQGSHCAYGWAVPRVNATVFSKGTHPFDGKQLACDELGSNCSKLLVGPLGQMIGFGFANSTEPYGKCRETCRWHKYFALTKKDGHFRCCVSTLSCPVAVSRPVCPRCRAHAC